MPNKCEWSILHWSQIVALCLFLKLSKKFHEKRITIYSYFGSFSKILEFFVDVCWIDSSFQILQVEITRKLTLCTKETLHSKPSFHDIAYSVIWPTFSNIPSPFLKKNDFYEKWFLSPLAILFFFILGFWTYLCS